jgi:hypothetical protein
MKLSFGSDKTDLIYTFTVNVDLTFVVALDLKYSPQIVCAHVMMNLESEKERLSE